MGVARAAAVVLVFAVSLAALAASSALALWEGTDELAARDRLRAAAAGLPPDHARATLPEADNGRLAEVARRVLANYPGAEGGFYLARSDRFAGAVLASAGPTPEPPALDGQGVEKKEIEKAKADKKGGRKGAEKKADKGEAGPNEATVPGGAAGVAAAGDALDPSAGTGGRSVPSPGRGSRRSATSGTGSGTAGRRALPS